MPTLVQVRNAVDAQLTTIWTDYIRPRQETYLANNGRYWQGLRTHTLDLEYTGSTDASAIGNNTTSKPTDEAENWLDLFPEMTSLSLKALFVCDAYVSPQGNGYCVTVRVKHNGNTYQRAQSYPPGNEGWRTYDWIQVS